MKFFNCQVEFFDNYYRILAPNQKTADFVNEYLYDEGFLDNIKESGNYVDSKP